MSTYRRIVHADGVGDFLGAMVGEPYVTKPADAGVGAGDQVARLHPFQLMRQP